MSKGAMTIAEGSQKKDYLTDATMVLNGESEERRYVLRTAFDPIAVWKVKYAKNISPSTHDSDKRRLQENLKIICGEAHFKALGDIDYRVATSAQEVVTPSKQPAYSTHKR